MMAVAGETMLPPGHAVASAHPLATRAGLEILAQGGNAFDAAIAVSAALAVVEPYHSGLGGGGFWLLHEAKNQKNIFIDGREVAPRAASKNMFLASDGKPIPKLSLTGGLSAAIPGEPAALVYIAREFGRLPLKKSLAPAIRLAEKGFIVDYQLQYFLMMGDRLQQLKKFPGSAAIFLHDGKPYRVGECLYQRDLANTLRLLAEKGHDGFYRGKIASLLVNGVNRAGGIWTLEDLASYQIKVREPLQGYYHQMHIVTAPLPSAGGIALLTMLNILADYPLQALSKAQWVHYLAEAMRLAFWQRVELLGDPDYIRVDVSKLLSTENTQFLRSLIQDTHATKSSSLPAKASLQDDKYNTTHFSILDGEGNRVAATLTINYIFGSSVVAEGTGVLLNDEMDDFSIKPKVKNVFGIIGSEKNQIEPGKRPLSSMTPTFLELPERVAILGTPGGSRIPTMVLLASLSFYDFYGAIKMVSEMRFHHQYLPDWLMFEPDTFSPTVQKKLLSMGYQLVALQQYYGDMQAITWDQKRQLITAASDPRHMGRAVVVIRKNNDGYGLLH
ncbi:gamma-glutamyltransferase [Legionella nagasakiensis]|uniref:gamma-glutamyltransferase n=1 Tax=Legionella nagasakiensis TaxID=535290 RepID=UPI001F5F94E6|nr:gamma-glutamyltransferase [Legionella nagasakiensis]